MSVQFRLSGFVICEFSGFSLEIYRIALKFISDVSRPVYSTVTTSVSDNYRD
jgi:hypothetical protein